MKIGIIGGGASGLFVASYLKRKYKNVDITIFDRNKSLGRKILGSGNGKCNFSNFKAMPYDYNNSDFVEQLYKETSKTDLINYFQSIGLMFYFDNEGRMYPNSNSSQTILNLFLDDLKDSKINLETTVESIKIINNRYFVNGEEFEYLVLATGSNAMIDKKKIDSTYSYLNDLNLKMVKCEPSLVGFKSSLDNIDLLSGYRTKATVYLFDNDNLIFREKGEIIFKKDGASGIVLMNASHYYKKGMKIVLNILNSNKNEFIYMINNRKSVSNSPDYYLAGVMHPNLINYFKKLGITDPTKIANYLEEFNLNIIDTYPLSMAQISKGGVSIDEINIDFSLKKYKNIFALGEMLDINGVCGGYNLMFCFLSALTAAKKIGKIYEDKNS